MNKVQKNIRYGTESECINVFGKVTALELLEDLCTTYQKIKLWDNLCITLEDSPYFYWTSKEPFSFSFISNFEKKAISP